MKQRYIDTQPEVEALSLEFLVDLYVETSVTRVNPSDSDDVNTEFNDYYS